MVTLSTPVTVPERSIPVPAQTVTVPAQTISASVDVDLTDGRTLLLLAGFPPSTIDVAQAIAQAESGWFSDAVGDLTLIDAKWGPSIGLFQMRSLRSPQSFGGTDLYRYAWPLRDAMFNARAALAVTNGGTDWSKWSTFTSGAYRAYLGASPKVSTGHKDAALWWR
jgi:hypothetical protein